jgi:hypothetical protein
MKRVILVISVIVIGLVFYSLFSSENVNSLRGDFKELAFERNQNNTGPIKRVYVFSLNDTLWSEMKKHVDLLPHTKYGTTEVYYFLQDKVSKDKLQLSLSGLNAESREFCIAKAVKDGQARIKFSKYPF